jgi:hypothetical protein
MVKKENISDVGPFDALMKSLREDKTGNTKKFLIFFEEMGSD